MDLQTKGNKAMILAAGLGTRLGEMTASKPKALLEWDGVPLLERVIRKLIIQGFDEVVINVHHFAELIMEFVARNRQFGIRIEFSHEKEVLLDTGGGIANASWFFGEEPFLVYNVDIHSDIDLRKLYQAHLDGGTIATLAVKERVTSRSLLMNGEGFLKGWRDNRTGETILMDPHEVYLIPIAFSAIYVLSPEIFTLFPNKEVFPIMPFFLDLARTRNIKLYRHDRDEWMDMGKKESYS
ncbi:MAG: nucleotidyltransferase family protein [Bacteroidales bacterium]